MMLNGMNIEIDDFIHFVVSKKNNLTSSSICYLFVDIVAALFVVTLLRVVITEFICLNAGRVLHNK